MVCGRMRREIGVWDVIVLSREKHEKKIEGARCRYRRQAAGRR